MSDDFIIQPLRDDLNIEVVEEDSKKYVILTDPLGIAEQPVSLPIELVPVLQLFDGKMKASKLKDVIQSGDGKEPDIMPVLNLFSILDQLGFIENPVITRLKEEYEVYIKSEVRNPVCAGHSYPDEVEYLNDFMDRILNMNDRKVLNGTANAIIVPHIDFLIGDNALETYSSAYNEIKNTDSDLFIIFGTAHYRFSDYLMFTKKHFKTPLGIVKTDTELIDNINEKLNFNITIDDSAHFKEHSIELQIVLLQSLFKDREFKILPILTGSFQEFIYNNKQPDGNIRFKSYVHAIKTTLKESGRRYVSIASVDFGHIGHRFGNSFEAVHKLGELKSSDMELIECLKSVNQKKFFEEISKVNNKWNICGVSPVYAMLETINPRNGYYLDYHQWNDLPTKSAVSFASMSFK